jgi:D-serine dehydratase
VTSDHGGYARHLRRARARGKGEEAFPEFRPALELWSVVQSVRDGQTALLTFGRRDCPYDSDLPLPLRAVKPGARRRDARPLEGAKIVRLNDQHAYLALPPGVRLDVGDRVACGIAHPCTAFDKWAVIPVVDDDYKVLDLYCTFF